MMWKGQKKGDAKRNVLCWPRRASSLWRREHFLVIYCWTLQVQITMPIHYSTSLREKRLSSLGLFMSISLNSTRPKDPGKILVMERIGEEIWVYLIEPIWANFWTKLILTEPLWAKLLGQAMPDLVSGSVQFRLITRKATARGTSQPTGGRIHTLSFLGKEFSKTLEESPLWQFTITTSKSNSLSKNWFTHTSSQAAI